MLASTVQFSKYGESLHLPHRQTPTRLHKSQTDRYDRHEALQRSQPHPPLTRRPARSLRTQQRAYNQLPTLTTFPTLPKKSRTSSNHESPAELVSVPPLSSVTNTRTHPRRASFTIRARLWTTITKTAASAP
jgi:hypothetical protein